MNTTTAPQPTTRHLRDTPRLRQRTEPTALLATSRLDVLSRADNDFLVPHPRPDLTLDPQTLLMVETR